MPPLPPRSVLPLAAEYRATVRGNFAVTFGVDVSRVALFCNTKQII
jgi:hypothetical protein